MCAWRPSAFLFSPFRVKVSQIWPSNPFSKPTPTLRAGLPSRQEFHILAAPASRRLQERVLAQLELDQVQQLADCGNACQFLM
jgi:hypothetical protein